MNAAVGIISHFTFDACCEFELTKDWFWVVKCWLHLGKWIVWNWKTEQNQFWLLIIFDICACGMNSKKKSGFKLCGKIIHSLSHRSMCAQAERKVIVISKSVFIVFWPKIIHCRSKHMIKLLWVCGSNLNRLIYANAQLFPINRLQIFYSIFLFVFLPFKRIESLSERMAWNHLNYAHTIHA